MREQLPQCVEIVQVEEAAFTKGGRPRLEAFEVWVTSTEQCSFCIEAKAKADSFVAQDEVFSQGRLSKRLPPGGCGSLSRARTSVMSGANQVLKEAEEVLRQSKSQRGSVRPSSRGSRGAPSRGSVGASSQGFQRSSSAAALDQTEAIQRKSTRFSTPESTTKSFAASRTPSGKAKEISHASTSHMEPESRHSIERRSSKTSSMSGRSADEEDDDEAGRSIVITTGGIPSPSAPPDMALKFLQKRIAERAEQDNQKKAVAKTQERAIEKEERQVRYATLAAPKSAEAAKSLKLIAENHGLTSSEVLDAKETFDRFDADHSGTIELAEFAEMLCKTLGYESIDDLPPKMLKTEFIDADTDGSGQMDFEEFLVWWKANRFEEALMLDRKQVEVRMLARKHDLDVSTADDIYRQFVRFDTDGSGAIDLEEFKEILLHLLKLKEEDLPENRLLKFWREVDSDGSGEIEFEEFMLWYNKYFSGNNKGGHRNPMQSFYQSFRPRGGMLRDDY